MKKAVVVSFHNYVSMFDHKYFDVISDYFLYNFNKHWRDELDKLYLLDSNWDFPKIDDSKIEVIKTDPNLRYYEAYKEVLPRIEADQILFLDNDMVIYRTGIVKAVFEALEKHDVVSIYDTIGKQFEELGGKSKFCPYLFAARKDLLMKYIDCEWGPDMPEHETLGKLTEKMLDDGIKPKEWEEDKNSIYLTDDGIVRDGEPKDLGYYHIRAGSTPAYLLTHKHFGDKKTYKEYIKNQPKTEYVRQLAWYYHMTDHMRDLGLDHEIRELGYDMGLRPGDLPLYSSKFRKYHGL